jgi:hypothetical protein
MSHEFVKDLSTEEKDLKKFRINPYFPLLKANPEYVFTAENQEDILRIIKYAKKNHIPLTPYYSPLDFYGSSLALEGGIVVDLSKLRQIECVRGCVEGMNADIEPGVSFDQLNKHLYQYNLHVLKPLRLPSAASVLDTYYGKHPLLESNRFGYQQDWMLLTYKMAIPEGYFIGTGSEGLEEGGQPGAFPFSPRMDIGRMFLGALGSFGIVSRGTCKLKFRPNNYGFLFSHSDNLHELIAKTREITLRTEAAQTVLISDSKNLASYIATSPEEYSHIINTLSNWTAIIAFSGEDELIQIDKADFMEISYDLNLKLSEEEYVQGMSSYLYNLFTVGNNLQETFEFNPYIRLGFYTTANRIDNIRKNVHNITKNARFEEEEKLGFLANFIECGRTYYCEYDIYHGASKIDPSNLPHIGELDLLELYKTILREIVNSGGVINTPRNKIISDFIYTQENLKKYYNLLRLIKYNVDPTNIMHPSIIFGGEGGINSTTTTEGV